MNQLYLPEEIILWGSFWCEELIKRPYKFTFMCNKFVLENIKNIEMIKEKNYEYDYLYLSQGTIGNYMSKLAIKHKENFPNDKILYRLHPHETLDLYPNLKNAIEKNLIFISSLQKENLYKSLEKSSKVLGVYSTSLIEAFAAGKKVGILNLPGLFYMENFINKYKIPVLENDDDLQLFIKLVNDYSTKRNIKELFSGI